VGGNDGRFDEQRLSPFVTSVDSVSQGEGGFSGTYVEVAPVLSHRRCREAKCLLPAALPSLLIRNLVH
jgi:hypothetical protein